MISLNKKQGTPEQTRTSQWAGIVIGADGLSAADRVHELSSAGAQDITNLATTSIYFISLKPQRATGIAPYAGAH
jgi:hypothetical protein